MDHLPYAERRAAYWLGELKSTAPPSTTRWTEARKRALLNAINAGAITLDKARELYRLTEEELAEWQAGKFKVRDIRGQQ